VAVHEKAILVWLPSFIELHNASFLSASKSHSLAPTKFLLFDFFSLLPWGKREYEKSTFACHVSVA